MYDNPDDTENSGTVQKDQTDSQGSLARFDQNNTGRIEVDEVQEAEQAYKRDMTIGGKEVTSQDVLRVTEAHNEEKVVQLPIRTLLGNRGETPRPGEPASLSWEVKYHWEYRGIEWNPNFEPSEIEYYWRLYDQQDNIVASQSPEDNSGREFEATVAESGEYLLELDVHHPYEDLWGQKQLEVSVSPPNASPEAKLIVDPPVAKIGEQLTFDASQSRDPDGQIEKYQLHVWYQNSSEIGEVENAPGKEVLSESQANPEFTAAFDGEGPYVSRLEVFDNRGSLSRSEWHSFKIRP